MKRIRKQLNFIYNYNCDTVETTLHNILHYPNVSNEIFFNKPQNIDANILSKDDSIKTTKVLRYGDHSFIDEKITSVLTASAEYIISTKRFCQEIPC